MHNFLSKYKKGSFGYDIDFLNSHKNTVVLKTHDNLCQVVVVPDWQGRVMTSTSNGHNGKSYGWINYDLISSGKLLEKINAWGGEDRLWLGPEGGQYSIFFKKGDEFIFDNWYTPAPLDTEPFNIVKQGDDTVCLSREICIKNYSGFQFDIELKREISLLTLPEIEKNLNLSFNSDVRYVAYESDNSLKNIGKEDWKKETGLLSIWILGMYVASDQATVIIPYKGELNLNTRYFGKISNDRLQVKNDIILFSGDASFRSKIGIRPENAKPFLGSYDAGKNLLSIVEYTLSDSKTYVNSLWKHQEEPYLGDVVNSYNDGPINGEQLGNFYELETSSSSRELKTGESIHHVHRTYHFEGAKEKLNTIALKILGTEIDEIKIEK